MTETINEATQNLEQWNGKRVVVVRNLPEPDSEGNLSAEVEGVVQVGNEMGLLIKPKGDLKYSLISAEEIEDIFEKAEEAKDLKASKIKPVKREKIKRHLLDRHGYSLEWVNSVTDEQAEEHHDGLVHDGLGHTHVAEEEKAETEPTSEDAETEHSVDNED